MEGHKMTSLLVVAFIVLATLTNNVLAKNIKSVQKDEQLLQQKLPLWSALKQCIDNCQRENPDCPNACLKDIAGKDQAAFVQYLKEGQAASRGIFCIAGCVATESCQIVDAGKLSMTNSPIKQNYVLNCDAYS